MIDDKNKKIKLLLVRLLENELTDEELAYLENWMAEDDTAMEQYCSFVKHYSLVHNALKGELPSDNSKNNFGLDDSIFGLMLNTEEKAPEIEISEKNQIAEVKNHGKNNSKSVNSKFYRLYSIFVSMAAILLVFFIIYVNVFPANQSEEIATIVDLIGVKWHAGSDSYDMNSRLLAHQAPYRIDKGYLKIKYDSGVELVLEGPAFFTLPSDSEFEILFGKVYSKVPQNATGFIVNSPNSTVIDLGTEFGVRVDSFGASDICLYKGQAQLVSGVKNQNKESQMLEVGKAKHVDLTGRAKNAVLDNTFFVKDISSEAQLVWRGESEINVIELLKGKLRFSKENSGFLAINHATGESFTYHRLAMNYSVNSKYNIINDNPYIDGAFIPDARQGQQVISSTGDIFRECPGTGSGWYIPILTEYAPFVNFDNGRQAKVEEWIIDGKVYDKSDSAMAMHSNSGITIDLNPIKSTLNGCKIKTFTAKVGISEVNKDADNLTDFWLLANGKVISHIQKGANVLSAINIDVAIEDDTSFLSFVVTDGGDDIDHDWWVIVDPQIHIE